MSLLLVGVVAGSRGFARAETVADAQGRAAALRAQLSGLQHQADAAVEKYDYAQGLLNQQISRKLSLEQAVGVAQAATSAAQGTLNLRARALYMSGGPGGFYATALTSESLDEFLWRTRAISRVVTADHRSTVAATNASAVLSRQEAAAAVAAEQLTRRQRDVAVLAEQVTGLLEQQTTALAAADSHVQDLVRIQQARADAAAAAAFQSRVNAAMSAAASDPSLIDPNLPAPTQRIATVLGVARQQLGKPYVWGAVGPDSFDCSGFTGYAYAAAGIALPRTAAQQYLAGSHPRLTQLLPGDLLFWATNLNDASSIDHMAMYLGNGLMIVAPHTGDIVKIQRVYSDGYFGATRVNPAISGSVAGPQWATFAGK